MADSAGGNAFDQLTNVLDARIANGSLSRDDLDEILKRAGGMSPDSAALAALIAHVESGQ